MNQQYKLSNELEKFAWLKVKLGADDFDAVTLLEIIQSETDIEECLLEIGESALEDEHSVSVIKLRVKELQERAGRLEERAEKKRRVISATMCNLQLEKPIQGPTLTLSLRNGGRGVIVTDPAKIPKQYFNDAEPKLDKRRLRDALELGPVEGAQLPNGGRSVSLLVK